MTITFHFGQNRKDYALNSLDAEKLNQARQALQDLLQMSDLSGLTFVDIGCGSGLTRSRRRFSMPIQSMRLISIPTAST